MLAELVTKLLVDKSAVSSCASIEQPIVKAVHGLQPDTLYKFYAISLTVAGPSYENSSLENAKTKNRGLVAGHYAAITIAVLVMLVFVIIGAKTCVRCCLLSSLYLSFV